MHMTDVIFTPLDSDRHKSGALNHYAHSHLDQRHRGVHAPISPMASLSPDPIEVFCYSATVSDSMADLALSLRAHSDPRDHPRPQAARG